MKNYAYVTLLTTNSYMPGLVGLWKSYKDVGSKYPLYCVITPEITKENIAIIEALSIEIIKKPEIPLTPRIREYNLSKGVNHNNWNKAFSKFHVFGLEQFDKIVYLDNDILLKQNIDDLFQLPHMSGVVDCFGLILEGGSYDCLTKGDNYYKYFNSGLLVIEPSMQLYLSLMNFIKQLVPDRTLADQNILALYYYNWINEEELHLPVYYNTFPPYFDMYCSFKWFDKTKVKVLHFVGEKPWNFSIKELDRTRPETLQVCVEYVNTINEAINYIYSLGLSSADLKIIK